MQRAFITGITGQDGQHLAEFFHGKGYDVYGLVKGRNNPVRSTRHRQQRGRPHQTRATERTRDGDQLGTFDWPLRTESMKTAPLPPLGEQAFAAHRYNFDSIAFAPLTSEGRSGSTSICR